MTPKEHIGFIGLIAYIAQTFIILMLTLLGELPSVFVACFGFVCAVVVATIYFTINE